MAKDGVFAGGWFSVDIRHLLSEYLLVPVLNIQTMAGESVLWACGRYDSDALHKFLGALRCPPRMLLCCSSCVLYAARHCSNSFIKIYFDHLFNELF